MLLGMQFFIGSNLLDSNTCRRIQNKLQRLVKFNMIGLKDALDIFLTPMVQFPKIIKPRLLHFFFLSSCSNNQNIRSEEHTSELQSHHDLVCRLLLEKK